MPLLLSIDTATNHGTVAISEDGEVVNVEENYNQKEHASFIHDAINEVLAQSGKKLSDIDAVAVVSGPGSYTGLRVSLSAAKGLCFVAGKPLIGVNTLQVIALAASADIPDTNSPVLIIPMIDARRMEVFTAVYDLQNQLYAPPAAMIVDEHFSKKFRNENFLMFAGDGSQKLQSIIPAGNHKFSNLTYGIQHVIHIAEMHFKKSLFEDVAYYEPFYLKPFFSTAFVKE